MVTVNGSWYFRIAHNVVRNSHPNFILLDNLLALALLIENFVNCAFVIIQETDNFQPIMWKTRVFVAINNHVRVFAYAIELQINTKFNANADLSNFACN